MCSCILGACLWGPRRPALSPAINSCGVSSCSSCSLSLRIGWPAAMPWHQQCSGEQRDILLCARSPTRWGPVYLHGRPFSAALPPRPPPDCPGSCPRWRSNSAELHLNVARRMGKRRRHVWGFSVGAGAGSMRQSAGQRASCKRTFCSSLHDGQVQLRTMVRCSTYYVVSCSTVRAHRQAFALWASGCPLWAHVGQQDARPCAMRPCPHHISLWARSGLQ